MTAASWRSPSRIDCVTVWDTRLARAVARIEYPEGKLLQLAVGPGAGVVATAIADDRDGSGRVLLWLRGAGPAPVLLASGSRLALSRGGDLVAAFGDAGVVSVWNTRTGRREYELTGMARSARAVAFADPGRLLTGDDRGTVTIWDTRTVREVLSLRDMTAPVDILSVADGRSLLAATRDGSARRWEIGPVAGRSGNQDGPVATHAEEHQP